MTTSQKENNNLSDIDNWNSFQLQSYCLDHNIPNRAVKSKKELIRLIRAHAELLNSNEITPIPQETPSGQDLRTWSKFRLRSFAAEHNIPGRAQKTRDELILHIEEFLGKSTNAQKIEIMTFNDLKQYAKSINLKGISARKTKKELIEAVKNHQLGYNKPNKKELLAFSKTLPIKYRQHKKKEELKNSILENLKNRISSQPNMDTDTLKQYLQMAIRLGN